MAACAFSCYKTGETNGIRGCLTYLEAEGFIQFTEE